MRGRLMTVQRRSGPGVRARQAPKRAHCMCLLLPVDLVAVSSHGSYHPCRGAQVRQVRL